MKTIALALCLFLIGSNLVHGQSWTEAQKKTTLAWIQSLQKANGGFAADAKPETPASMSSTATALRALHQLASQPKNKEACTKFVMSCFDMEVGGFAPLPGGKADKKATAFGLMAAARLRLPSETYQVRPVIYLCSCVKKMDDIQRTAAAYEIAQSKCELAQDWMITIQDAQNSDGTFGKENQVSTTARAVVTLRRLGGQVKHASQVLKTLKAAQHGDGGWGKGDASDLETSFRVVEALVYLKDRPNGKIAALLAKCRNDDGGYGLRPGEPGNIRATYFACAILAWLNEKE